MSHHLDSPIARQDIRLDITDLYVFRGETGTVFAINVCHSIFGPIPVPGYHPEGMYEFKVDLNGDAVEDVTYRLTFKERDEAGKQRYIVRCIRGVAAADPNAAGTIVAEGTTDEIVTTKSGLRVWAGKAGDPFWIEPDVLHAVGHSFQDGKVVDLSGWDPDTPRTFSRAIPCTRLFWKYPIRSCSWTQPTTRRIGVWAVSTLATDAGGWRSINRVGLPMIHPLFTQYNEDLGNRLNAGIPADDFATFGKTVINAVAGAVALTVQRKILRPMRRKSRIDSAPISSPTWWARRRCLALSNGMGAP